MSSIKKFRTTDGDVSIDYNGLDNLPTIPSKITDLTNDSDFINKNVGNLTNYYSKDEMKSEGFLKEVPQATGEKVGGFKVNEAYGYNISSSSGALFGVTKTKEQFDSALDYLLISKGTLNNVLGGETNFETKSNKTTSISATSTDTEYPSAKAVYDLTQGLKVQILTQEQYNAIPVKDEETLYFIV